SECAERDAFRARWNAVLPVVVYSFFTPLTPIPAILQIADALAISSPTTSFLSVALIIVVLPVPDSVAD
ncbi:hypothetical protein ONJ87_27665, partial [Salmonella enterica subsp. enterica serovar Anatum]|nr:hypothetical protein [Salmonella enterica subsp. enterica serovar Anatum]